MKLSKWIYWTPRILAIVFILGLIILSGDVFDENLGFWGTILGLFIHNIPALILAVILWISWKREIVGAIAFILGGIAYILSRNFEPISSLVIAGPAFLIGVLFLIGWIKKRK